MITRIEATNYRCFDKLDVELGEFRVLVGANGSGKTTLLDIPVLLGDLLRARSISDAWLVGRDGRSPRATTLTELVHKNRGDWLILCVEAEMPSSMARQIAGTPPFTHLRYELRLQNFNGELQVEAEYLFAFRQDRPPPRLTENGPRLHGESVIGDRRGWAPRSWRPILIREKGRPVEYLPETKPRLSPRESPVAPKLLALPGVQFLGPGEFSAALWLHELLVDDAVFFDPDWDALRMASPPIYPRDRIIASARNAPWLAQTLSNHDPDRFERWQEHVRAALPQVVSIEVKERDDDHAAYFKVRYEGDYSVTSSGLSDGTLRILVLTLLAYLPHTPRYLVTEEPENGIHPRAIDAVMQGLEFLSGGQTIVSSHSPVVVARSDPDNLLISQVARDGAVNVVAGRDHPVLLAWKGKVDLASLFATGVLE